MSRDQNNNNVATSPLAKILLLRNVQDVIDTDIPSTVYVLLTVTTNIGLQRMQGTVKNGLLVGYQLN